jgi:hypothetical protein
MDDTPMPASKKSHVSKRSVLGGWVQPPACDPELSAISNSDPGNPAIPQQEASPAASATPLIPQTEEKPPSQPAFAVIFAGYCRVSIVRMPNPNCGIEAAIGKGTRTKKSS